MSDAVTRAAFERRYAADSGFSVGDLRQYLHPEPCDCGEEGCQGWQMVGNDWVQGAYGRWESPLPLPRRTDG